jgi:hypothetical protein
MALVKRILEQHQAPAEQRMVAGHPWPSLGKDGVVTYSGWWDAVRVHRALVWRSKVHDAVALWAYGPAQHRLRLTAKAQAAAKLAKVGNVRGAWKTALGLPDIELPADVVDSIEAQVAHAERCRSHLVRMARAHLARHRDSDGVIGHIHDMMDVEIPGDGMLAWLLRSWRTMRRLAAAGLVPLPPEDTFPVASDRPVRHERLTAAPQESEAVFG